MNMFLTTLGFFLLTALCILHHLNRTQSGARKKAASPAAGSRAGSAAAGSSPAGVSAPAPAGPPCPRRKIALPAGAAFCPGCGIPQQIFELVTARTARATRKETAGAPRKVFPLFSSRLREIRPGAVVLEMKGKARLFPNDNVIIRIGGDPPRGFLKRIGVRIVEKDVPLPAEGPRVARAS